MVCRLAAAILMLAYCSAAQAQSGHRAEVEFGGAFLNVLPAVVMGGTGWMNERAGVAARVYLVPGYDQASESYPGVEASFRFRRFSGGVAVDVGMGLLILKRRGRKVPMDDGLAGARSGGQGTGTWKYVTMDVLLGRRVAERLGVKVGVGCVLAGGEMGFVTKALAVVPLWSG